MKNNTEIINDLKFRIIAIPLLALAICIFFNAFFYLEFGIPVWKILVSNLAFTLAAFESTRFVVVKAHTRFSKRSHGFARYFFLGIGIIFISLFVGPGHLHFEKDVLFHDPTIKTQYDYFSVVGSTIFFTLVIAGFYEAIYFFKKWNNSNLEKEQLAKSNIETQYELLKNQVQPHFLFNSLNTLTALVDEDTERAKRFIKELALVYRHLLQSNEKSLIPLSDEFQFIKSYSFLLKTRFGDGLIFDIQVDSQWNNYLIPPLTLQILVENAVKHNRVESKNPLFIKIYIASSTLIVKNNLIKKATPLYSTKLGLTNVSGKYRLLNLPDIQIQETQNEFIVSLPLVHP